LPGRFSVPEDFDTFQSEYIRLFEVGRRGGAPCPLYGGHYSSDRLRTLESLIRFYNFFGLQTHEGLMPDHVSVELEFMQYLAEKEADATDQRQRASLRRAQSDFLDTHLNAWWPQLVERVRRQRTMPFYRSLAELTLRFLKADRKYLDCTQGS